MEEPIPVQAPWGSALRDALFGVHCLPHPSPDRLAIGQVNIFSGFD